MLSTRAVLGQQAPVSRLFDPAATLPGMDDHKDTPLSVPRLVRRAMPSAKTRQLEESAVALDSYLAWLARVVRRIHSERSAVDSRESTGRDRV